MPETEDLVKVAFVGTSCIGKTTLVEKYRSMGIPKLVVVSEAARDYFTRHTLITDRFSDTTQGSVQELALENERIACSSGATRIVCDRSVLDAVAYVRSQGDIQGSKRLLNKVHLWLPTYNRLLLLNPADVPYQVDFVRREDEQVRQGFHLAFIELFNEEKIPYELLSGTVEQRVARVNQLLRLGSGP